jgi:uroporphyrinogen-III decarboxylase
VGFSGPDWRSLSDETEQEQDGGIDAHYILRNYDHIEKVAEQIPLFAEQGDYTAAKQTVTDNPDRYRLGNSWFCLYERLWTLRGMENILTDFYQYPDELRLLARAIADFHMEAIHHFGRMGCDGMCTSDDLGTQNALMMSPLHFREVLKPLFADIIATAHQYKMHFWLHTCGNVTEILDDFIEIGLDVIHPIQHSTYPGGVSAMDPVATAQRFGGKITFWAGVDVQYLLPLGTPDEVRAGLREQIDTFDGPNGGMMLAAGNAIMPETPLENIEACLDEAYRYGEEKRQRS